MTDSAGPLSQDDVLSIQDLIVEISSEAMGQGIFALLASMALYTLLRKGLHTSIPRLFLFAAVIILILSTTLTFSFDLAFCLKDITQLGPSPVSSSLLMNLTIPETICSRVNYLISDLIVVWRAWVLSDRRLVRIALAICILITLGCMIPECFFTILPLVDIAGNSEKNPLLDLLMMVPVIATNAFATSIVAYKTWVYRTQIKVHFQQGSRRRIEKILTLLVESGAIYCAVWILTLIAIYIPGSQNQLFSNVMTSIAPYISAIYPVSIILLVELGKVDDLSTTREGPGVSRSIRFASASRHNAHSNSIIQSIADHVQSKHHDENPGTTLDDVDVQQGRFKEEL